MVRQPLEMHCLHHLEYSLRNSGYVSQQYKISAGLETIVCLTYLNISIFHSLSNVALNLD